MAFEVRAADVAELEAGDGPQIALQNAARKARAVIGEPRDTVLGVDTVVVLDGRIYGKPTDEAQARATLSALSARRHEVLSGVCVRGSEGERTAVARTEVDFRELSEELLAWYLASGEWRDRAGGYAIQGRGAALVRGIEGDYLNVVGLPLATLLELVPDLLDFG